jgi:hypothetical protein
MASNSVGSDLLRYPLSKQLVSYSSSEDEDCDHTETPDDAEIPGEAEIFTQIPPPQEDQFYETADQALKSLNAFTREYGYA